MYIIGSYVKQAILTKLYPNETNKMVLDWLKCTKKMQLLTKNDKQN
jgi:hypothetical protein